MKIQLVRARGLPTALAHFRQPVTLGVGGHEINRTTIPICGSYCAIRRSRRRGQAGEESKGISSHTRSRSKGTKRTKTNSLHRGGPKARRKTRVKLPTTACSGRGEVWRQFGMALAAVQTWPARSLRPGIRDLWADKNSPFPKASHAAELSAREI